ncbi:MAG: octanoyltransferase, partial [Gammaproteobacteria bacterium]
MSRVRPAVIRHLGLVDYEPTWRRMQAFTDRRDTETRDEIWFLQHPPVFTMGMNASPEHLLA